MYIAIYITATAHSGVPCNDLFTINYAIHCILDSLQGVFLGQASFSEGGGGGYFGLRIWT